MAEILAPTYFTIFDEGLRINKKLKIFELVADTPDVSNQFGLDETAKSNRYFYKFLPLEVGLTAAGIMMYDNKVAIINVKKDISGIILHNKDYYHNSKKLFDFIWKMLPTD